MAGTAGAGGGRAEAARGRARPARGLRERQKAEREERILRAAKYLFGRRGYAETTMEDVARRAHVAVGTIYNYFPSKPEIVLALLRRETGETLAAGDAVLAEAARTHDARAATAHVGALFDVYVELLARHEREQLRELLAAALANSDTIGKAAFEMDARLLAQLHALLERLREGGALADGVDTGEAALLLYSVYASWLFLYAASDDVALPALRDGVRRGIALALRGILRAPASSATA
jgi:AcrR family transcriptional regulator